MTDWKLLQSVEDMQGGADLASGPRRDRGRTGIGWTRGTGCSLGSRVPGEAESIAVGRGKEEGEGRGGKELGMLLTPGTGGEVWL